MRSKILVCINDTPHARIAVKFASQKAKKSGKNLILLNVIAPSELSGLFSVGDRQKAEKTTDAERILQEFAELAFSYCGIQAEKIVREGNIAAEIIDVVNGDGDIGMLVMGAASISSTNHKVVINLATSLGDKLVIPLTIIPGNLTDQQIEELA